MNDSPRTKVFIATFATVSALYCVLQATMHLVKYQNILDFNNEASSEELEYDKGCLSGAFTDTILADERKARICGTDDKDCAD